MSTYHVLDAGGETVAETTAAPDVDGLRVLAERFARFELPVRAAIESMNGARFVHDQLELAGWDVEIADVLKVKGLAPLACKTDRIDVWVLAELARRDLVPAIWLPSPGGARPSGNGPDSGCSDLFGVGGRELLASMQLPEPWNTTVERHCG